MEFEGAFYHVFSRGNDGELFFLDDFGRISFINLLGDLSEPDIEIPQQRILFKDIDPEEMDDKIARIIDADIGYFKETGKNFSSRRLDRDKELRKKAYFLSPQNDRQTD
jgi:hypothetical protein